MTYEEVVKKAKAAVKKIDTSTIKEHFAIEIDVEGEGAGALYIELDHGKAVAEPYDYYDNDCCIRTSAATLIKLLSGKLDPVTALSEGSIFFAGNWEKAVALAKSLKPVAAKKAVAPKKATTAKKTTAKKATATKKAAPAKKETATKKTAEKKPAEKKPIAKKPAAKKTTTKK
ncbi:MAG: SCP2 sterol-binding domain-containing protein [Lachnospiraceae bacterium]|nr:SCP2 sterol-binding domain-containing protein [Lachnospiraceae bacterium]